MGSTEGHYQDHGTMTSMCRRADSRQQYVQKAPRSCKILKRMRTLRRVLKYSVRFFSVHTLTHTSRVRFFSVRFFSVHALTHTSRVRFFSVHTLAHPMCASLAWQKLTEPPDTFAQTVTDLKLTLFQINKQGRHDVCACDCIPWLRIDLSR